MLRNTDMLLEGRGCAACAKARSPLKRRLGTEELIRRFREKHADRYDYSAVRATRQTDKITLVCPVHGAFVISCLQHMSGRGCQKCGYGRIGQLRRGSIDGFLPRAARVHGGRYDYAQVAYSDYHSNVTIVCREHGPFVQTPNNHLQGKGCPTCGYGSPRAEEALSVYLASLGVEHARNWRGAIAPYELDLFIPAHNLAIEHCGLYWHSDAHQDAGYHKLKRRLCKDKGIRLLQVFEDEWVKRPEAVKALIRGALGLNPRLAARKTEVMACDVGEFLDTWHHAGAGGTRNGYALLHEGRIVMALTLRPWFEQRVHREKDTYEVARVASSHTVVGGLSKLLQYIRKELAPQRLISFCDLRYFSGHAYKRLGFNWVSRSAPTGWYVRALERKHPRSFTKARVEALLGHAVASAPAAVRELGYNVLHDCGHDRFELVLR
jgi:ribosomal protein L37E